MATPVRANRAIFISILLMSLVSHRFLCNAHPQACARCSSRESTTAMEIGCGGLPAMRSGQCADDLVDFIAMRFGEEAVMDGYGKADLPQHLQGGKIVVRDACIDR